MNYLRWHYLTAPKFIVELNLNYLLYVEHLFSVRLLLKTLFSPWRRLTAKEEKHGLSQALDAITFDLISRVIGFIVRFFTILTSLIFFALVLFLGIFLFIFWLLIPIFSLPIYFWLTRKESPKDKENFIKLHLEDPSKQQNVQNVSDWYKRIKDEELRKSRFWSKDNLLAIPGIGKSWAFGYTPTLDKLTEDLSSEKFSLERLVGREKEITQIQTELSKPENNNVILVGTPGSGLKTLTIGLAKLIQEGKVNKPLILKRVLFLDTHILISNNKNEVEKNLISIFIEAKNAGNILLVVPWFEEYLKPETDLGSIFSEQLQGENLQLITLTDPFSFQKYILKNSTLMKIFQKIDVLEISKNNLPIIVENEAYDLEKKYKVCTTYEAILEIIKEADELISDVPFPQKAIDILEEAVVSAQNRKGTRISEKDIDSLFATKTKIPIGELEKTDKEKLKNLEKTLHEKVIGQDFAIEEISQALKRKATGVDIKNATIGSFLFLGPTGVGKTHTAKSLAEVYFEDAHRMIRLDMSEFQTENDIKKLIGDEENPGILTSKVRENPFTVLLLDEFEKANQKILNLFLTVFDEGYLTDGSGKKVNFKNTIVIATSNAGSEFIREQLKKGTSSEALEKLLIEYLLSKKIFSPELLNRFDSVIFYKPLTKKEIEEVAKLLLLELNEKLKSEHDLTISITPELVSKLVEEGYDETFGARNMQRVIEEKIESNLAKKILDGETKKGQTVEISL